MTRTFSAATIAMACATLFATAPAPLAADYFESDGQGYGPCAEASVTKRIASRFGMQAKNVLQRPELKLLGINNAHENRSDMRSVDPGEAIERHYCHGTAYFNDGQSRPIWFLIEKGMGFASIGDNVEFCVSGFDEWNVYNSACRTLK